MASGNKRARARAPKRRESQQDRYRHSKERARERYGLALTDMDMHAIERKIREGEHVLIEHSTNTRSTHIILCQGKYCKVTYSKRSGIVTFLPISEGDDAQAVAELAVTLYKRDRGIDE